LRAGASRAGLEWARPFLGAAVLLVCGAKAPNTILCRKLASGDDTHYVAWSMQSLGDIATEEDIKHLVDSFYQKVNEDELLSPIFNGVAQVDWQEHLPTMYKFWGSLLLQNNTYRGQPWPKHAVLPVNPSHFARWLTLFKQTVDEHFAGPKAVEARNIAASIADTFQNRMQFMRSL
jgi:hemoglobin